MGIERPMFRVTLLGLLLVAGGLLLWGCSGGGSGGGVPVRQEIANGDLHKDWALVYFQSWRRDGDGRYLQLARQQMRQAIDTYFNLQVRIGHSFPDFYTIDRKRRQGCRFLSEVSRVAARHLVRVDDEDRDGCFP